MSDAGDDGVCVTAAECLDRSGQVSGKCAQVSTGVKGVSLMMCDHFQGFGSCCLLYTDQCGGTLTYNNTYIM